ncbi:MAG: 2-C-methyl-D-erythritol 4-phosphate cytidylyltransferase [Syntrophomonadaceae bacterium]|jgi:2-C-methyl-D-erythritol 4-phosphate cytidylyltransferase
MADNLRVVIAAAGTGSRMGSTVNKQYMLLKNRPILAYSLDSFEQSGLVDEIVVVAKPEEIDYCRKEIVERYQYRKVSKVIAGGRERQDSVWAGLRELYNNQTDYVAVHDGARPLFPSDLLEALFIQAQKWGAAIPGVFARDTLKTVDQDNFVNQTLDRTCIIAVQTPQIFNYSQLYSAYEQALRENFQGTDDAVLFEKYMGRVKVVTGEQANLKITTPEDLIIAESYLESRHIRRA